MYIMLHIICEPVKKHGKSMYMSSLHIIGFGCGQHNEIKVFSTRQSDMTHLTLLNCWEVIVSRLAFSVIIGNW
jgi:hypothetical protein